MLVPPGGSRRGGARRAVAATRPGARRVKATLAAANHARHAGRALALNSGSRARWRQRQGPNLRRQLRVRAGLRVLPSACGPRLNGW